MMQLYHTAETRQARTITDSRGGREFQMGRLSTRPISVCCSPSCVKAMTNCSEASPLARPGGVSISITFGGKIFAIFNSLLPTQVISTSSVHSHEDILDQRELKFIPSLCRCCRRHERACSRGQRAGRRQVAAQPHPATLWLCCHSREYFSFQSNLFTYCN